MADLLRAGTTWLSGVQAAGCSQSVTYRRGSTTSTINAVVGRFGMDFTSPQGGVSLAREDLDFIIRVADLGFEPAAGNVITLDSRLYKVSRPDDTTPCFSRDEDGLTYRIHTKFSGAAT